MEVCEVTGILYHAALYSVAEAYPQIICTLGKSSQKNGFVL